MVPSRLAAGAGCIETRQVGQVEAGAAPEVGDDRSPGDVFREERGAVEEAGSAAVAPLLGPRLVHRHGVAIHVRSIATS